MNQAVIDNAAKSISDAVANAIRTAFSAVADAMKSTASVIGAVKTSTYSVGDTVNWDGALYSGQATVLEILGDGGMRIQPVGTSRRIRLSAGDVASDRLTLAGAPVYPTAPTVDYSLARTVLDDVQEGDPVVWLGDRFKLAGNVKQVGDDFIRITPTLKVKDGQYVTDKKVIKLNMDDLNSGNLQY